MKDQDQNAPGNSGREDYVRDAVRERYAGIVEAIKGPGSASRCCGGGTQEVVQAGVSGEDPLHRKVGHTESLKLGYTQEDLAAVPEGANLGLGCGNPKALAALQPGEVVVDLGAGAGFDCFLAAKAVGPVGGVIGVDMTPEMVRAARENARKGGYENVDFRLGEIEHLPVADGVADVVISNCVINLSPNKQAVYNEAFRALRPGGRLAVSDVVATAELPAGWLEDMRMLSGCIAGASTVDQVEAMLAAAGFVDIDISAKEDCREFIREWQPGTKIEDYVLSANMTARRP